MVSLQTDGDNLVYFNRPYWLTIQKDDDYSVSQTPPFNSPNGDKRPVGISAGYVSKQWVWKEGNYAEKNGAWEGTSNLNGLQAGIRFEPLFRNTPSVFRFI